MADEKSREIIEQGLVPVFLDEKDEPAVDGRTLHSNLGVGRDFSTWMVDKLDKYGFAEGIDFSPNPGKSTGGRPTTEYTLTLDCAKELAMAEHTEQGHAVRQYFIRVEKEWNSPEKLMARALRMADKTIASLQSENAQQKQMLADYKPKVNFANSVAGSVNSILVRDLAKLIAQNGVDIGEKRLFRWLRENGYLIARIGRDYNSPTQYSMGLGLMEVKETAIDHASGYSETKRTPLITGKGQQYFIEKITRVHAA